MLKWEKSEIQTSAKTKTYDVRFPDNVQFASLHWKWLINKLLFLRINKSQPVTRLHRPSTLSITRANIYICLQGRKIIWSFKKSNVLYERTETLVPINLFNHVSGIRLMKEMQWNYRLKLALVTLCCNPVKYNVFEQQ